MSETADERDHSSAEIIWHGEPPSPERVALVRQSIREELADLGEPSDLIFHIVFFEKSKDGATATLWGEPETKGAFHAEWSPITQWESL